MYKFMRKLKPLALLLSFALVAAANANDWPAAGRPIQLTVPSPGGGGTGDTIARLLAEQLAINLKTSIVIDNRPGANGNIGAAAAAKFRGPALWQSTLTSMKKLPTIPKKILTPLHSSVMCLISWCLTQLCHPRL
jgi:tripartite-type tricarboxylate transporter receptor subunit TctC